MVSDIKEREPVLRLPNKELLLMLLGIEVA